MNILFIGDVCGRSGRDALFEFLPDLRYELSCDFVIANGENSAGGLGITKSTYDEMTRAGVDFFTLGNHAFSKANDAYALLNAGENIIRPENMLPETLPGRGIAVITVNTKKVAVINIIGRVYMEEANDPFKTADALVIEAKKAADIIIVDFHAEATSEKEVMGYYLDGRVSAVLGTHTHVQTADEKILPKGTAYITDVGMTGAEYSVLGMDVETAVGRFLNPEGSHRYRPAYGKSALCAVLLDIDENTGLSRGVKRIWKR